MSDSRNISQQLKSARLDDGTSQETLACRAGLTRQTLSKFENGGAGSLSLDNVAAIAHALGYQITLSPRRQVLPTSYSEPTNEPAIFNHKREYEEWWA